MQIFQIHFSEFPTFKILLNRDRLIFFPVHEQHRDTRMGGLFYEDDYKGNALAGVVTGDRVEIRFHKKFTDSDLREMVSTLRQRPELKEFCKKQFFYQGRPV